jgi:hypothetical protein
MQNAIKTSYYCLTILILFFAGGCGPFESGVLDTGVFNTGGTDDPRRLIEIAYNRMYYSNRIIGAWNVLGRAIKMSIQSNDMYALAKSYNMMGYTYIDKERDIFTAEKYYNKAIKVIEANNFNCELVHSYIGLALVNMLRGIPENACAYKRKANNLIKKIECNYKRGISSCEGGMKSINDAKKRIHELNNFIKQTDGWCS